MHHAVAYIPPEGVRFNTFPGGIPKLGVIGVVEHAERIIQVGSVQHFADREHQIALLHSSHDSRLLAVVIGAISEKTLGYTSQTSLRTGATSGVGLRHMARKDSKICALFGAGDQAVTQLLALKKERPIEEVRLRTRTPESRKRFAETYGPLFQLEIRPIDDPQAAVVGADVVITATNTNVPVLHGAWLEPGQHVTSIVGSNIQLVRADWLDRPRRELDDEVICRVHRIAVNSREQVIQDEQGDIYEPVQAGLIGFDEIAELGEIVNGTATGRESDREITLHKNNAGMGFADVAVSFCAFERAKAQSRGRWLDLTPVEGEESG